MILPTSGSLALPTSADLLKTLPPMRGSVYGRAAFDPARTLVSGVAERVGAVTVGEPHSDGLAGQVGGLGLWMLDKDGHVWRIVLYDAAKAQREWRWYGERLRRADRAPWRWLPYHDRVRHSIGLVRSMLLDRFIPQGWEGLLRDVAVEHAESEDEWAAQDLSHLLNLWTTARMAEGHSPGSARLMLSLLLPAEVLAHPVVAQWREGRSMDASLLGLT